MREGAAGGERSVSTATLGAGPGGVNKKGSTEGREGELGHDGARAADGGPHAGESQRGVSSGSRPHGATGARWGLREREAIRGMTRDEGSGGQDERWGIGRVLGGPKRGKPGNSKGGGGGVVYR